MTTKKHLDASSKFPWRAVTLFAVFLGVIFLLGVAFNKLQRAGYERLMFGPYYGKLFVGEPAGPVISSLKLTQDHLLTIYSHPGETNPVLCLQTSDSKISWCRILVPVQTNNAGGVDEYHISEISLTSTRRFKTGHAVSLSCNWNRGGREGGVIYLSPDYDFQSFKLSW